MHGLLEKRIPLPIGVALILTFGVASVATADTNKTKAKVWDNPPKCLEGEASTSIGDQVILEPDDSMHEWRHYGRHTGWIERSKHQTVGIPPFSFVAECVLPDARPPGELSIMVQTFILTIGAGGTAVWRYCAGLEWVENQELASEMFVNLVPAQHRPLCGEQWYKTQVWVRSWDNGSWKPAANICTKTLVNNCIRPVIQKDPHWLWVNGCHAWRETQPGMPYPDPGCNLTPGP